MIILLVLITVAATISQVVSFRRMVAYVENEFRFVPSSRTPLVSVILPCKGIDPGFKGNIDKLMQQDYKDPISGQPAFEIIFSVASQDDPAYPLLKSASDARQQPRSQVVVAGTLPYRAQKVNNQLAALEKISPDSEVLVFVDSDVIARPDFLRYLIAHLDDPSVGATTGYRFYIPFKGDWPSLIRSLWNRMTAWELACPTYAFAWGGAMACRRETFQKAGVWQSWDRSADDDLALTTAIKSLGLQVRFVPQCLVASHGDASFKEIVEWTNRQLVLTKVYYPKLWLQAIKKAVVLSVWLVSVLSGFLLGVSNSNHELINAALVGLTLLPVELLFLCKAQGLWRRVLAQNTSISASSVSSASSAHDWPALQEESRALERAFRQSLWRFTMVLPLAHLVLPWMTLYSLLTNRITWRGITYELKSPTETLII